MKTRIIETEQDGRTLYTPQYRRFFLWRKVPNRQRIDETWYSTRRDKVTDAYRDIFDYGYRSGYMITTWIWISNKENKV